MKLLTVENLKETVIQGKTLAYRDDDKVFVLMRNPKSGFTFASLRHDAPDTKYSGKNAQHSVQTALLNGEKVYLFADVFDLVKKF